MTSAPTRTPLYQSLAARISIELLTDVKPGERLQSERVLCERFGVSRVTLRAALAQLAEGGVLTASAARGWFVADAARRDSVGSAPVAGFTETAAARGQQSRSEVLKADVRAATLDEAEIFGVVPGSEIFELSRLRRIEELLIAVDHSRIPAGLCPGIETHDFTGESLYGVLRSAAEPVLPTIADYSVEALAPSAAEREMLQLPAGVPLLVASQVTRDQHGRTFEIGSTRYRGDRYRFRASLGGFSSSR